jgi:hypothetical protein
MARGNSGVEGPVWRGYPRPTEARGSRLQSVRKIPFCVFRRRPTCDPADRACRGFVAAAGPAWDVEPDQMAVQGQAEKSAQCPVRVKPSVSARTVGVRRACMMNQAGLKARAHSAQARNVSVFLAPRASSGKVVRTVHCLHGEVVEWLMAPHSKCGVLARVSGVRIPPSPPYTYGYLRVSLDF